MTRYIKRVTFQDLVDKNIKEIEKDEEILKKIDKKIEERHDKEFHFIKEKTV